MNDHSWIEREKDGNSGCFLSVRSVNVLRCVVLSTFLIVVVSECCGFGGVDLFLLLLLCVLSMQYMQRYWLTGCFVFAHAVQFCVDCSVRIFDPVRNVNVDKMTLPGPCKYCWKAFTNKKRNTKKKTSHTLGELTQWLVDTQKET